MIALTQEKREELIKFAKATLNSLNGIEPENPNQYDDFLSEYAQMCMEIALASLTADKLSKDASESLIAMVEHALSHRICMGMDEGFKSFHPEVEHDFVQEIRNFIASGDGFFTAPPVPEIKLINPADFIWKWNNSEDCPLAVLSAKTAANNAVSAYAQEIKRLNGLGE